MSVVTNILLCTAIDDEGVRKISDWLVREYGDACALKPLHPYATGTKAMEVDVFGVAVNYCLVGDLVVAFRATPWDQPYRSQLLVKHEDWDTFRLYEVHQ